MAPILPHMAEDIWQALPYATAHKSAFQAGWPSHDWPLTDADEWAALRACRDQVNRCIETARVDKAIGASLEAKVLVQTDDAALKAILEKYADGVTGNSVDDLHFLFLTSQVELVDSAAAVEAAASHSLTATEPVPLTVGVAAADGAKCDRCWHYSTDISVNPSYPGVCTRCADTLDLMGFAPVSATAFFGEEPAEAEEPAAAA